MNCTLVREIGTEHILNKEHGGWKTIDLTDNRSLNDWTIFVIIVSTEGAQHALSAPLLEHNPWVPIHSGSEMKRHGGGLKASIPGRRRSTRLLSTAIMQRK